MGFLSYFWGNSFGKLLEIRFGRIVLGLLLRLVLKYDVDISALLIIILTFSGNQLWNIDSFWCWPPTDCPHMQPTLETLNDQSLGVVPGRFWLWGFLGVFFNFTLRKRRVAVKQPNLCFLEMCLRLNFQWKAHSWRKRNLVGYRGGASGAIAPNIKISFPWGNKNWLSKLLIYDENQEKNI